MTRRGRNGQSRNRRHTTLLLITIGLNMLLWTSMATFFATLFLFSTQGSELTMLPSQILSIASSVVSMSYVILHSLLSMRQDQWSDEKVRESVLNKTCYIAIRLAVALCILWLLTSGWNLILAARLPLCFMGAAYADTWNLGVTCIVSRVSAVVSLVALVTSFLLFGILAVVRRPFEAHLFGQRPAAVRIASPTKFSSSSRSASCSSEKTHVLVSQRSALIHSIASSSRAERAPALQLRFPLEIVGLGIQPSGQQASISYAAAHPPSRKSSLTLAPICTSSPEAFNSPQHTLYSPGQLSPHRMPIADAAWWAAHPPPNLHPDSPPNILPFTQRLLAFPSILSAPVSPYTSPTRQNQAGARSPRRPRRQSEATASFKTTNFSRGGRVRSASKSEASPASTAAAYLTLPPIQPLNIQSIVPHKEGSHAAAAADQSKTSGSASKRSSIASRARALSHGATATTSPCYDWRPIIRRRKGSLNILWEPIG